MRILVLVCFALNFGTATAQGNAAANSGANVYVCTPCGSECDAQTYSAAGKCTHCQMDLVRKESIVFKSVKPEDVCAWITAHPKAIILDVRTPAEFEGKADPAFGSLKGAINIPIQELERRAVELEPYKSRDILVYCSHSHRSPRASYMLNLKGFESVTNMDGGMSVMKDSPCKK